MNDALCTMCNKRPGRPPFAVCRPCDQKRRRTLRTVCDGTMTDEQHLRIAEWGLRKHYVGCGCADDMPGCLPWDADGLAAYRKARRENETEV